MPKYIQIKDRRHQRGCSHQTPSMLCVHCPHVPLISITLLPRFPFHRTSFYNLPFPFAFSPFLFFPCSLFSSHKYYVGGALWGFFLAHIPEWLSILTHYSHQNFILHNISEIVRAITFHVAFPCNFSFASLTPPPSLFLCFLILFGQCVLVLLIDASIVSTENEWDLKLLLRGIASKIVTT